MLVDHSGAGAVVEHRTAEFSIASVVDALDRRHHPNREFVASVLPRGTFVEANDRAAHGQPPQSAR